MTKRRSGSLPRLRLRLDAVSWRRCAKACSPPKRSPRAYRTPGQRTAHGHRAAPPSCWHRGGRRLAAAATTRAMADAKGSVNELSHAVTHAWALSAAGRSQDVRCRDRDDGSDDSIRWPRGAMGGPWPWREAWPPLDAATLPLRSRRCRKLRSPCRVRSPIPFPPSDHVPIWSSLGRALFESGRPAEALPWFQKVVGSGQEHLREPLDYVRSFYFLGRFTNSRAT